MRKESRKRRWPRLNRADAAGTRFLPVYLVFLCLGIAVVYATVLKYFLAQDDFVLLEKAAWTPGQAILGFFLSGPGQFRPLSKGLYFVAMWRIAGVDASWYHVASLLLHIANTLLAWRVVSRIRPGGHVALIAATLFGLNTAFFHVLAWASCVQQLMCLFFVLLSLEWGWRAAVQGRTRDTILSVACYVLALCSMEQAMLLPAILMLLIAHPGTRSAARRGVRIVRLVLPHFAVLAAYALFVIAWKTLPQQGTYQLGGGGANALLNLWSYLGWSARYLAVIPSYMNASSDGVVFTWSHAVFLFVVGVLAIRRRWADLAFGGGFFLLGIFPVLLLSQHTFYLHTYVPGAGVAFLFAVVLSEAATLLRVRRIANATAWATTGLVAMIVASFIQVRSCESARLSYATLSRRSFVVRRALAARHLWDCLAARRHRSGVHDVYLVYPERPGGAQWSQNNIVEATGKGSAVRLLYGDPTLRVHFVTNDSLWTEVNHPGVDVFFYDDLGDCRAPGLFHD